MIDDIDDRAREILALRTGEIDGKSWTLDEVAERFGLSRERVRYIEATTLRKMRA